MKRTTIRAPLLYHTNRFIYSRRYDLFSLAFMALLILWYVSPLFAEGHIVFSDIDFPLDSRRYLEEILGLWNRRWSTGTLLNLPRLVYVLPSWLISSLFRYNGALFFKTFVIQILLSAALSQYLFVRKLLRVYVQKTIGFPQTLLLIPGALFYALNPWVVYRIQHIYLLCGYSLFPLLLLFFFNSFDPHFQELNIRGYSPFYNRLYRRNLTDTAGLGLILSTLSAGIHYFFYSIILLLLFFVILLAKTCLRYRHEGTLRLKAIAGSFLLKGTVFSSFFLMFSFHWLSIYLGGIVSGNRPSQFNINVIDTLSLFSRNSSLKNVLYLNSYWWPMFPLEELPLSFHAAGGLLLTVILIGIVFRSWRHGILFFFTLLTGGLILFGTGVKLQATADLFILLVTKVPVLGPMFRDPDKLVGILALCYSILFTFGLISLGRFLARDTTRQIIIRFLLSAFILIAFIAYLNPYRNHFIKGFYAPVDVPGDYSALNRRFEEDSASGRVLYLPVSESMIQSHTGVATPFWNVNPQDRGYLKPTGDFHVYNSLKDTLFHHEGSIPEISYFLRYLQYQLDRGLSRNIVRNGTVFSADEIIYHNEYLGHETRQNFNLALLGMQTGISRRQSSGIFSIFTAETRPEELRILERRILTPYGLSQLEGYWGMEGFDWARYGVLFAAQNRGSLLSALQEGDLLDVRRREDLLLSSLDPEYYLNPFDFINDGNPYLRWAKTRISTPDWSWYLQSQGIESNPFDFDLGVGMGVSFSSSRLDLPPHRMEKARGSLLIDFNSMLRIEKFFTPDNPQLFSAQANPLGPGNTLPVLHGEIQRGESENVWQVAKSGKLKVTGDTPYQFRVSLSGRGTNKMHVKVRFFDIEGNELGVSYVIAPSEETSFDGMTLYGEYVSPAASRYMRIDLLSYQRPEQKVFWWIHDIQILDLKDYRAPNTIDMIRFSGKKEKVRLFLRAFRSPGGGTLKLKINGGQARTVDSRSSMASMTWYDLGTVTLEEGNNALSIENRSGFNAVNTLALIPEDDLESLLFPIQRISDRASQIIVAEAEADFKYSGMIQTRRSYPALHAGRGIRSDRGKLTMDFDVLQDGRYDWTLYASFPPGSPGRFVLRILDERGRGVYERSFVFEDLKGGPLTTGEVVFDPLLYKDFPRRLKDPAFTLPRYGTLKATSIPLPRGRYTLEIHQESESSSLASIDDIRLFDPSRVRTPFFLEDIFQENCSDCLHISEEMSRREITEGELTIRYDPTCSCDWYVYSTPELDVNAGREYWIGFTARSERLIRRHSKILFLNEKDEILGTEFISEVEEIHKVDYNPYEQIFTVPEGAVRMVFQIWGRGNKSSESSFQMKDLKIFPLDELLLLDAVLMEEKQPPPGTVPMRGFLAVSSDSFSNQRLIRQRAMSDQALPVNSVSTGFVIGKRKIPDFYSRFSLLYRMGLILFPAACILYILLMFRSRSRRPYLILTD